MDKPFDYFFNQTSVVREFTKHIEDEANIRILFSGKFGTGKSTFLNQYFNVDDSKYIVLKLSPINYSVASNEDVFELIKYDLFAELLANHSDKLAFNDEDFSPLLLAQSYISSDLKIYPFLKALFKASVPKGEQIINVVEAAKDIYYNFKSYEQKMRSNDKGVIDDYIKWCENRKGSIYEYDEITALITELIVRVKKASEDKKVVLIVDDLDRLDPEHVFRLFNIFSAHYDLKNNSNKFNLDKVIFVCDYNNIQNMYTHRYGIGVDFEGYINKFYSINVFEFDNRKHLNDELNKFFESKIQVIPEGFKIRYPFFNNENYIYQGLLSIFTLLIENKQLTIRNLNKFNLFDLPNNKIFILDREFPSNYFFFLTFIHLLVKVIDKIHLNSNFEFLEERTLIYNNTTAFKNENAQYYFLVNQALFLAIGDILIYSPEDVAEIKIGKKKYEIKISYDFQLRLYIPTFKHDVDYDFNVFTFLKEVSKIAISKTYI